MGKPSAAAARHYGLTYLRSAILTGDDHLARRWAKAYAKTLSTDTNAWKDLIKRYVEMVFKTQKSPAERAVIEARILKNTKRRRPGIIGRAVEAITGVPFPTRCHHCKKEIKGQPVSFHAEGKPSKHYHTEHAKHHVSSRAPR